MHMCKCQNTISCTCMYLYMYILYINIYINAKKPTKFIALHRDEL